MHKSVPVPFRVFIVAALFAVWATAACGEVEDSDVLVMETSRLDPLPGGVQSVIVSVSRHVKIEKEVALANQTYSWDAQTLSVATEALVLPAAMLVKERTQLTGQAHLRIEPTAANTLRNPRDDLVFALQYSDKDGWKPLPPPTGYRWHSIASVRVDPLGPFLVVTGEACMYTDQGADNGQPLRHCEYARRWARVPSASVRMIPFPAWSLAVTDKAMGMASYRIELVDADEASLSDELPTE